MEETMWRKNQEAQTPPPVPAKPAQSKVEANNNLARKLDANKPEPIKSESIPAPLPVPPAATESAPAPAAPIAATPAIAASPVVSAPLPTNIDSRISSGLKIRGEITGSSDMYIDGDVQGKVRIGSGRLTIGANGRIQADLEAREIIVNGSVVGNLKADDRVQLGSTGSVQGGIITPRIGIDDGARLRGNVETARSGESRNTAGSGEKEERRALAASKGD
jgi:cytoskeletal protein CcmA (bactofilin family)